VERYGRIDVMFNNAGIGRFNPVVQHSPEDFDAVVKVNQYGVFYGIQAAARKMLQLGIQGTIINTCSVFGFLGSIGVIGYHASKGAVKMMTQAAAYELAMFGIRVVGIAPGGVDTPIIEGYKMAGLTDQMAKMHMRGRLQKPEEIANVVAFLATEEANAINGSIVMVDDGYAEFK
jgi:glucose 1-dehydrogenase